MPSRTSGLTLVETIAALAIVAITTTLALPAMTQALERQRVATTLHLLSADMAMARGAAIMRRSQVVVCPRASAVTCAEDGDWSSGWLVFLDDDRDRLPDSIDDLLRSTEPTTRAAAMRLHSTRPFVRFQRDGRAAHSNLSVHLCARGMLTGSVVVNRLGRVRSERMPHGTDCPRLTASSNPHAGRAQTGLTAGPEALE